MMQAPVCGPLHTRPVRWRLQSAVESAASRLAVADRAARSVAAGAGRTRSRCGYRRAASRGTLDQDRNARERPGRAYAARSSGADVIDPGRAGNGLDCTHATASAFDVELNISLSLWASAS